MSTAPHARGHRPGLLTTDSTLVNVARRPTSCPSAFRCCRSCCQSFAGSAIGGIRETEDTLDYYAEHGIGAEIEVVSADGIDEAWEPVLASDVRYRFVIDTPTLGA